MSGKDNNKENMVRLNSRVRTDQAEYVKEKIKRSKTKANPKGLTEGEVYRDLLDKGIRIDN